MRAKARPRAPLRTAANAVGVESGLTQAKRRPAPIGPQQCCGPIPFHMPPAPGRRSKNPPEIPNGRARNRNRRPLAKSSARTFLHSKADPLSLGTPCQGRKTRNFTHSSAERNRRTCSGPKAPPSAHAKVLDTPGPDRMGAIERRTPTGRARRPTSLLQLTARIERPRRHKDRVYPSAAGSRQADSANPNRRTTLDTDPASRRWHHKQARRRADAPRPAPGK
jgi:hypothetical protein